MASWALWSVLILSAIPTIRSDVTLLSPSGEDTIHTMEGETISFACSSGGGIEGPEVLQINNNIDDLRSSRITMPDDDGVYQFSDIVRDDNGTLFQCFVNAVPSNYLILVVELPPAYIPGTYNYTVIEGTPLRIQLELEALRAVTAFNWTKDGSCIQSDTETTLGADYINFGEVSREDAGTYRVTAEDSAGMGAAWLTLEVYYPPRFVAGSGVINLSAITGSSFTLDCSWSANPTGSLQTSFTANNMMNIIEHDNTSQSVTIEEATTEDKGNYTCIAENTIAITRLTYVVVVGVLPTVVVQVEVSQPTDAVLLQGTYEEDNFDDPVIRFYVTVANNTMTATPTEMSSFSVSFSYDLLEEGVTYTVYVMAENAIGNGTLQPTETFTIQEPTDAPSENVGNLHVMGTWILVLAFFTAILL